MVLSPHSNCTNSWSWHLFPLWPMMRTSLLRTWNLSSWSSLCHLDPFRDWKQCWLLCWQCPKGHALAQPHLDKKLLWFTVWQHPPQTFVSKPLLWLLFSEEVRNSIYCCVYCLCNKVQNSHQPLPAPVDPLHSCLLTKFVSLEVFDLNCITCFSWTLSTQQQTTGESLGNDHYRLGFYRQEIE